MMRYRRRVEICYDIETTSRFNIQMVATVAYCVADVILASSSACDGWRHDVSPGSHFPVYRHMLACKGLQNNNVGAPPPGSL